MENVLVIAGLALAVLYGIGVLITLVELWRAPHGYEDEHGFHVVRPPQRSPRRRIRRGDTPDHPASPALPA